MILDEDQYLMHYGILRKSGRYPWGSGGTQNQRNKDFLDYVDQMRGKGLSDVEICKGLSTDDHPFTTTQLRAARTLAKNQQKQSQISQAQRLKTAGLSNVAIGTEMGLNESTVRSLLRPGLKDKVDVLEATSNKLKDAVAEKGYIDVGSGVGTQMGISQTKLGNAVAMLQEQGYGIHYLKVQQLGTGKQTTVKVLAAPGTTYSEVFRNRDNVQQVEGYTENGGRTYLGIHPPISISSKRVDVVYGDKGGAEADGVIYVRPGVKDVSLGGARYAQVRVAIDGTHYLKGMAVYKNDLPEGVDLQFNTVKHSTGNKLDALKKLKDDPDNPFGSTVHQIVELDKNGKETVTSSMNKVYEEGQWDTWSRTLSSQFLSKQSPTLAKAQLEMTYENKRTELNDIMKLTNPAVRKKLLDSFADDADSSSVHLKAAHLPRQAAHVILPVKSLKENEVYAPNYDNGERVVLVRHPHGGPFEIPELVVNNRNREANSLIRQGKPDLVSDAIGIHPNVAKRLSGADFDGDQVIVIPNDHGKVKTAPALAGLKDFDPQSAYPPYHGMKTMDGGTWNEHTHSIEYAPGQKPSSRTKQVEMGNVSNLITDMSIQKASNAELARAVRHSMVVIDAEKHSLNYKESARVNGIKQLKEKYQGRGNAGASTLISRAGSEQRVSNRKGRSAKEGGPVDKETGEKKFTPTNESFVGKDGKVIVKGFKSTKLAETTDARTLLSKDGGTVIEKVYADHSNRLKALANTARKASINTRNTPYSESARKAYAPQVASLKAKLALAEKNRPLERQAQILANAQVSAKRAANPNMDSEQLKKIRFQALEESRRRTGAHRNQVEITSDEWAAIQAGAISNHHLTQILQKANLDQVKKLATPRTNTVMTAAKQRRAEQMLASGYTQSEVADALGVALSTLKSSVAREEG